MNGRKNQKQLWADKEFIAWLKKLRAKKELEGEEIRNLGELTKQLVKTEAIKEVENQVLKNHLFSNDLKIKLDARRLLK
jgi:hypothetical protein